MRVDGGGQHEFEDGHFAVSAGDSLHVRLAQESCTGRPCKLRLIGREQWKDDAGIDHIIIVGVAEVKDDCHACAAILGMGQFRRPEPGGKWQAEVLTPAVDRIGGHGVFGGKVIFAEAGRLGRVVRLDDSGGGMGEFGGYAAFYIAKSGAFKSVLTVSTSLSVRASCDAPGPQCNKKMADADYESTVSFSKENEVDCASSKYFRQREPYLLRPGS